jgi:predicted DNA-binding protein (UPF0251 family)
VSLPDSPVRARAAEIYDRYAIAVFRQALLMLDDEVQAARVALDVIADECASPPASADDGDRASRRLAVSVLQRCEQLTAGKDRARRRRTPPHDRADSECLDYTERAVLGLVIYGGLGYREAARELAISPPLAAATLRAALITMASALPGEALR